jgi:hypothetical protein
MAEKIAANGRNMAMIGPNITQERATESTPVSGVEIKKEVVEAREAPDLDREMAAGNTPQEQSGRGAPITAALMTAVGPDPPNALATTFMGNQARINPAAIKPNNSQGAESRARSRVFSISASITFTTLILRLWHRIYPTLVKRVTA